MKQESDISTREIEFEGKKVKARLIKVTSIFNFEKSFFFKQELTKKNTPIIVRPLAKITFVTDDSKNETWQEGFTYGLIIKPFGLVNLWGIHYIHVKKIDRENGVISTREKNNICKVWDHTLTFKKIENGATAYSDEVLLYAGKMTGFLSRFIAQSYLVRHRNWNKLLTKLSSENN